VAARDRGHRARLADGQHLLRSPRLAAEVVAAAGVARSDLVVEVGAGSGRLTAPLADAAGRVVAIELDPRLAEGLRRRFAGHARVTVVEGDALVVPSPDEPHRVVGNVPFHITTALLRSVLGDPGSPCLAADLIVQDGLARKRCAMRPCTMLSLAWLPWWRLSIERLLPAGCFEPRPSVDAALLAARRREPALLPVDSAGAYRALLRRAFDRADQPVRHTAAPGAAAWKRLARDRGLPYDARPRQLDVWDWVALFGARTPASYSSPS
jgi:23S rRNA (adenine-N6)-dimethyltransferase